MKRSAMKLVAIAVLVRTALATMPVLADDMLEHASADPASAIASTETMAVQRDQPSRELLMRIAGWLSVEFGLSIDAPPHVEFATRERLSRLRFRGVPSDHLGNGREVVAIYDDDGRAIYVPRGWSGSTAAEMSILVHEMVHHAQNLVGTRFACPQEREKLAYEAQQRWLVQSGSDLAKEFEIDGFTLLVLTNCGF